MLDLIKLKLVNVFNFFFFFFKIQMTVVQALDKSFSANRSSMSGKTFGCVHHKHQLTLLLDCLLLPFVKLSVTLLINL